MSQTSIHRSDCQLSEGKNDVTVRNSLLGRPRLRLASSAFILELCKSMEVIKVPAEQCACFRNNHANQILPIQLASRVR